MNKSVLTKDANNKIGNKISEILVTMDYGPAPESTKEAQTWLDAHQRRFGLFIDNKWSKPGELFAAYNPADGSKIAELVHPMLSPNGIGLSPDEKTVYVADTESSRLFAFDIVEPGVLRKEPFPAPYTGRLVCGLPGFQRFDSLAVETSGNIAVATLITGHITVIAPDGRVVRQVKMPDVYPTNICFGGPDLKTAYVTLSGIGQLAAMDWPEPGLRLNFQE